MQLWREWRNNAGPAGTEDSEDIQASAELIREAKKVCARDASAHVALVLPTSLCSGQIALNIAEQLTQSRNGFTRAVALPHTEGCGNSGGESERLFLRTMAGYLAHPLVKRALLLEHG